MKAAPWQHKRFWCMPPAHALLHTALAWRASTTGLSVALQTHTSRAALAYLNDHQIQVCVQAGRQQDGDALTFWLCFIHSHVQDTLQACGPSLCRGGSCCLVR